MMASAATDSPSRAAKIVVVESDSTWEPRPAEAGAVVINQLPHETPGQLSSRVMRQIEVIARCGHTVERAVLATSESIAEDAVAARYAIVRALLTSGVMAPGARVVLAGDERLPAVARHGLLGLAGAVISELSGLPFQFDIRLGGVVETDGAPMTGWQNVPSA
jgi:hypothetical protein